MKLETQRLILQEINETHAEDILRIRSNEMINKYVKRNSPKTNYDALEFILNIKKRTRNKEIVFWGISYKNQVRLIGTICLWNFSEDRKIAEVGYELLPDYHQQGIMSEALKSVLDYGMKSLQLEEILAFTSKHNSASQALLTKNAFVLEEGRKDDGNSDNIIFSLKNL
ncbi:GNAT family N-acetyltransferase [Chryseobacterium sp. Tr-659]|uniref:GNAT family N-acetyltransferase n=1 Tax=Chryseobacterium sp. Tr-659 TaxID=2608340 RepID=UPI001420B9C7|nr:GNAT family N-acetyltransferase [Chryseobacterium sp. Tr-659]NIF04526.1 GNAT family N-acetyltransferase [Chryseobacterium sp. Tr-659]